MAEVTRQLDVETQRPGPPLVRLTHPFYMERARDTSTTRSDAEISRFSSSSSSLYSSGEDSISDDTSQHVEPTAKCISIATQSIRRSSSSVTGSATSSFHPYSKYADDYYPLIECNEGKRDLIDVSTIAMAHAYNSYIRAINAYMNHAPLVSETEVADFLLFGQVLLDIILQHRQAERKYLRSIFEERPKFEIIPPSTTKSMLDGSLYDPLSSWAKYTHDSSVHTTYSGEDLRRLMGLFAPQFVQNLHEQVCHLTTLLKSKVYSAKRIRSLWAQYRSYLSKSLMPGIGMTLLLSCHDRNFTVNGYDAPQTFPKIFIGFKALFKPWHVRQYRNVLKFCPSDLVGNRRLIVVSAPPGR